MSTYKNKIKHILFVAICSTFLQGCTDELLHPPESTIQVTSESKMYIATPRMLGTTRLAPDKLVNVRLQVSATYSTDSNAEQSSFAMVSRNAAQNDWTVSMEIPQGVSYELNIVWQWSADEDGIVDLARVNLSMPSVSINGNVTVNVSADQYTTEGAGFDIDNDGNSNIKEVEFGTDIFSFDQTTFPDINLRIPWIDPSDAPTMNGLYETIWDQAIYSDTQGNQLSIDNLLRDNGAGFPDQGTPYRFGAMHDDEFLYLYVEFDDVNAGHRFNDSGSDFWEDDTVNIFLDGNNSRQNSYDGIDDSNIYIKMGTNSVEDLFAEGTTSAKIADVRWGSCLCTSGQDTWEIAIRLSSVNITKYEPFGFDVHLIQDSNGGLREANWGWHHPSGSDTAFQNPSAFGTVVLVPRREG